MVVSNPHYAAFNAFPVEAKRGALTDLAMSMLKQAVAAGADKQARQACLDLAATFAADLLSLDGEGAL